MFLSNGIVDEVSFDVGSSGVGESFEDFDCSFCEEIDNRWEFDSLVEADVILDQDFLENEFLEEMTFSWEKVVQLPSHLSWEMDCYSNTIFTNFDYGAFEPERMFSDDKGLKRKFDEAFEHVDMARKSRRLNEGKWVRDVLIVDDFGINNADIDLEEFEKLLLNLKLEKIACALNSKSTIALKMIIKFNKIYKNKGDEMMKEETVNKTLVNIIISFLRNADQIPYIEQIEYITILGLLSRSNCGREYIMTQGGVSIGTALIKKYHAIPDIFSCCLLTFGNMVNILRDQQHEITKNIVEEKIVNLLLNSVKTYSHNTDILQHICFVLGNLAFIGFENLVIMENGIETVLESMEQNINCPQMLTEAIFLFKNLAYEENGRNCLMKHKVIEILIPIIIQYISNIELVELSINLIYDLSFAGSIEILQETKSFQIIFDVIKTHNNNFPILKECLRTLGRAYSKIDIKGKIHILKAGAIDIIIDTYKKK